MGSIGQSVAQNITLTVTAQQAAIVRVHDARTFQFQVDVIVHPLAAAIDTTRTLAQPLDELEVLVIHGAFDMQQTHAVPHLLGHLFLKGSSSAQAHFHHVTIGA